MILQEHQYFDNRAQSNKFRNVPIVQKILMGQPKQIDYNLAHACRLTVVYYIWVVLEVSMGVTHVLLRFATTTGTSFNTIHSNECKILGIF